MRLFSFLFVLFPILELVVLIQVGSKIGVLATILLIILSAIAGITLIRVAGVATALRARERLIQGLPPEREMLNGLLMAVGGVLLLIPGFISDFLGVLCLLPFMRGLVMDWVVQRSEQQRDEQRFARAQDANDRQRQQSHRAAETEPAVLEGEFQRADEPFTKKDELNP